MNEQTWNHYAEYDADRAADRHHYEQDHPVDVCDDFEAVLNQAHAAGDVDAMYKLAAGAIESIRNLRAILEVRA